jgi:hypothetical protein
MTTHSERCQREATRDVIFLFQARCDVVTSYPPGVQYDGDGGFERVEDDDGNCLPEPEPVTVADIREMGDEYTVDRWNTEGVWLDRDEAETYGNAHAYNYPDGWRVYGVPSYGQLAEMLRKAGQ